MRKLGIVLLIAAGVMILLPSCQLLKNILGFGERDQFDYGVSAMQWLPQITEKAKTWREDAYFYGISEARVNKDGNSDSWSYLFYSPGSDKTAAFVYDCGFISLKEVVLTALNPAGSFKLDSPAALQLAYQSCQDFIQENKHLTTVMALVGPPLDTRTKVNPKWLIKIYGDNGVVNIIIDAVKGDLKRI